MNEVIQILIVDDHAIVRKGLRTLIESEPGFEVIGEAGNGMEGVESAKINKPDIILMDLVMPKMDGITAIAEIMKISPRPRVIVLTSFGEDDKIFPALRAGAAGFLLKDTSPQELLQSIRDVAAGKPSLHPSIASRLMHRVAPMEKEENNLDLLTEREVEVLKLVARGLSNQEIAGKMVISDRTVSTHLSNILEKLNLENRTQAALFALRKGLTSLFEED
jgi:two-component system, NarL family, response regulator LiaR